MFSRILTKLIDEAILPAILLVAAKIVGVIVSASYFGIPYEDGSSFFTLYFSQPSHFLLVNSYSIVFMLLVVLAGTLFFLLRSRFFHDTHMKPSSSARVFSLGLGRFVQTSFDVYAEGTIWLSYSILLTVLVGMELYFRMVYPWVFIFSMALCAFLILIFVSDVEREL